MAGATLIAAVGAGIAEIGEAGGVTDTIVLSPTAYAAELIRHRRTGRLVHPDGLPDLLGLKIVQVPGLADPLLYDARRCYLVLGHDSAMTLHDDWEHDAKILNVSARVNVGVPVAHKSLRMLEIGGACSGSEKSSATRRRRARVAGLGPRHNRQAKVTAVVSGKRRRARAWRGGRVWGGSSTW